MALRLTRGERRDSPEADGIVTTFVNARFVNASKDSPEHLGKSKFSIMDMTNDIYLYVTYLPAYRLQIWRE